MLNMPANVRFLTFEESMSGSFNANSVNIFRVVPEGGLAIMRGFQSAVQGDDYVTLAQMTAAIIAGGGGEDIEATLINGDDAQQQNLLNLADLSVDNITNTGINPFTITDSGGGGGGLTLNIVGTLALDSLTDVTFLTVDVNMSNITGSLLLPDGSVGVPAVIIGDAADQVGFYQVSPVRGGMSIGGTLVALWDADGISTSQITELIGGVGIALETTTGLVVIKTADYPSGLLFIDDAGQANLGDSQGDVNSTAIVVDDATQEILLNAESNIRATSLNGSITLTPSTGFAACTGTENKLGFDADNVIFTAGALQDLARSLAALWNATFTKGYITV